MDIKSNYQTFAEWLVSEWLKLPNNKNLAFPYVGLPSGEYQQSKIKVLVMNRETNSWGNQENFPIDANLVSALLNLYGKRITTDWDNLGSVWPMYYALRCLAEGETPEIKAFMGEVGFHHSNVALIGKKYGNYGYDPTIIELLIEACDRNIEELHPDIILLGVGFGTKTNKENNYLEILESTEFFGKLINSEPITGCSNLLKLKFTNSKRCEIYGFRHPQGLSYRPIVEELSVIIQHKLAGME